MLHCENSSNAVAGQCACVRPPYRPGARRRGRKGRKCRKGRLAVLPGPGLASGLVRPRQAVPTRTCRRLAAVHYSAAEAFARPGHG